MYTEFIYGEEGGSANRSLGQVGDVKLLDVALSRPRNYLYEVGDREHLRYCSEDEQLFFFII